MINYFDILAFLVLLGSGYVGAAFGVLIVSYLVLLGIVIGALVKAIFVLEKMKAYILLFVSTIVLSIISVSFFGLIFSDFFKKNIIRKVNKFLGMLVGIVAMLILFRTVLLPLSMAMPPDIHQEIVDSYTMNNLAPLTENILPGAQESLWQGVNSFIVSLKPPPPKEKKNPEASEETKPKQKKRKQRQQQHEQERYNVE